MAELSLRERLQPALLDRLIDEERLLTLYVLTFERAGLLRLGILRGGPAWSAHRTRAVTRSGRRRERERGSARLRFCAPSGRSGFSQLKGLLLKPPGASEGVLLENSARSRRATC